MAESKLVKGVRSSIIRNLQTGEQQLQVLFDKLIKERTWFVVLTAAVVEFKDKKMRYFTGYFTYNAFLAVLALVVALAAVLGFLVQHFPGIKTHAIQSFGPMMPVIGGSPDQAMSALAQYRSLLGFVSFLGLIWTGTKIFSALEWGFCQIWGSKRRSYARRKLFGLGMISAIGGLFMLSLVVQFAFTAIWGWMVSNNNVLLETGNLLFKPVLTLSINFLLFLALYQWVPTIKQSLKRSAMGAASAGFLFMALQYLLAYYFSNISKVPAVYGGLATAVVLVIWLQLTGLIVFLGGEIIHVMYSKEMIQSYRENANFETLFRPGRERRDGGGSQAAGLDAGGEDQDVKADERPLETGAEEAVAE